MGAHTPGPWFIPTSKGSSGGVAYKNGYIAFTSIPREVSDRREDGESWLDMRNRTEHKREAVRIEEKANARLIAAAPDLLEACLLARHICEPGNALQQQIDAAIAKATGEQA